MVEHLTHPRTKGSNLAPGTTRTENGSNIGHGHGSTMVEHLTQNHRIKGSELDPGTWRQNLGKMLDMFVCPSSTLVEHLTRYPSIKGSNFAPGTARKKMSATLYMVMVTQW